MRTEPVLTAEKTDFFDSPVSRQAELKYMSWYISWLNLKEQHFQENIAN